MSVLDELKRRNVGRVAIAYAIVAWVVVEVMSVFAPALKMPEWVMSFVAVAALIGFPIALVLSWVYELTPAGLKRTDEVPAGQSIRRVTAQRLNYLIIGALAVALVFVVVDAYVLRKDAVTIAPAAAAPAPTAAPSSAAGVATHGAREVLANSVAVLPFANLSPNADDAYFAQGIHEEVLNQLAKIDALSVIARTSVLRYADGKTSLPDIARELNVQAVMEGSVRYAGDSVRITAQLIDPKTGTQLWSEAYQRKFEDIFTIQADIAMNIANALRAEFSLEEQREIERPLTTSPEAYALYLRTRTVALTPDALLALLDRAIELDPSFAAAYGRKARAYCVDVGEYRSRERRSKRGSCRRRAAAPRERATRARARSRGASGAGRARLGRHATLALVSHSRAVGAGASRLPVCSGLGSRLEGGPRGHLARDRAVGGDRSQLLGAAPEPGRSLRHCRRPRSVESCAAPRARDRSALQSGARAPRV